MSKTLTIRNIPEPVYHRFTELARKSHRNAEAHGRFLIERETQSEPLDTCGEILDAYAELPPPNVEVADIEAYQANRGRRSRRP
jgi:hypothetical protein